MALLPAKRLRQNAAITADARRHPIDTPSIDKILHHAAACVTPSWALGISARCSIHRPTPKLHNRYFCSDILVAL